MGMSVILGTGPTNLRPISANLAPHFCALAWGRVPRVVAMLRWTCPIATLLALLASPAMASPQALPADWAQRVGQLAEQAARVALPADAQVEVEVGALDARLRLAPCAQVQPFVPAGQSLWGRSRLGLRCQQGAVRWSVTVPVQVRVIAPTWVAAQPLPAGTVIAPEHLRWTPAEVSADSSPVLGSVAPLGRTLARALDVGEVLRQPHLKARQWFAAGDTVQVSWQGQGFAISAEGQALGPGLDGQSVRVRVQGGRIIQATPVGERRVEAVS